MNLNTLKVLLCLLILFYGCNKASNDPQKAINPEFPELGVDDIGISGTVFNGDGSLSSGARVTIEGKTIITDASGYFKYTGKVKNTDKVVIKVTKQGYLKYSKILVVEKNAFVEGVDIWLTLDWIAGTFNAATGGIIKSQFATLTFQPNSFIKEDGSNYSGTVTINMYPQPRSRVHLPYPGDTRGITTDKENIVIEGFFGIAAFAYGSQGEELYLSKTMNYSFLYSYDGISSGYDNMMLWAYDLKDDIWKQCGTVSIVGGNFTGTSSALSYLQVGIPRKPALLRGIITDNAGNKASGFWFGCVNTQRYNSGTLYTTINSNGAALLYVPADMEGKPQIITPCTDGVNAYGEKIKPIPAGDKGNQTFIVNLSPYLTVMNGKIEDCDYKGLKGTAVLKIDNRTFTSTLKDGWYNFKLLYCQSFKESLSFYDESNNLIHRDTSLAILPDNINIAPITVCNKALSASITIEVEGKTYTFDTPRDSINFITTSGSPGNQLTAITAGSKEKKQGFYITYVRPVSRYILYLYI